MRSRCFQALQKAARRQLEGRRQLRLQQQMQHGCRLFPFALLRESLRLGRGQLQLRELLQEWLPLAPQTCLLQ